MAPSVLTQAKGAAAPVRVQATAKAGSSARLGAASALSRKAGLVPIFSRTPRASSLVVNTMAPDAKLPFSPNSDHLEEWVPSSWRALEALQQPNWPSQDALAENLEVIKRSPPLVFAGESRDLQNRLAQASRGEAFLLQGGDCAESFDDFSANHIRDTYRVLLQMSAVVMYGGGVPVVKIGRMAGQFAKPRSADTEIKGDEELPSYRGDIINGPEWSAEARVPDPSRLVRAYHQSAATLNLIRGFSSGGYASLERVANWNLDFMENSEQGAKFKAVAKQIDESLRFMEACGIGSDHPLMKTTEFYTSHECLLLDYEEALTREDSTTGLWYDCSAHMIWCGERTRQLDKAHVEFLKGVGNPLGVKVSDKMPPQDLVTLCQMLNPDNVPGRITIIVRMGAENVKEHFPKLVRAAKDAGIVVTWVSDPMHGNTISAGGYKTRPFESVCAEVMAFFDVHDEEGSVPGGVHLEMTGEDVTECTGGGALVSEDDLSSRYHTHCDPRLNAAQSLELAFIISTRLRQHKELVAKRNGKPAANWN